MIREELTYELVLEDESDEVYAVSLVSQPAIELGWVAFDKEEVKLQSIDEDKRLVMGPILIPEKRIIRVDGEGKTYHVFLKANTIEKLAQKYLKNKYNDAVTVEHEAERIDNVSLVESWIVESTTKDKSALYGFAVPKGTWMGIMKIDDAALWEEVKSGKSLQGFSIEGLFSHQLAKYSTELDILEKDIEELTEEEARVVLSKIKTILEAQPSVTSTYPGEVASGSIAPALLSEDYGKILPKDIPVVLQADDDEYERGLIVTYLSNGGYDVQYWYDEPNNIVSAEIKIDGKTITPNGKLVHIGYHPELD